MHQVEIDFEVFKALTNLRPSEDVTYNDVIRDLLKLPRATKANPPKSQAKPWIVDHTSFPPGSEFKADYKGKTFVGAVKDGKFEVEGSKFSTPSAAAVKLTGTNVNGWRFWQCKLPGSNQFVPIERLRGKTH